MDGARPFFFFPRENKRQTKADAGPAAALGGPGGDAAFYVWGFDFPVNTQEDQREHPEVTERVSLTQQSSPVRWDPESGPALTSLTALNTPPTSLHIALASFSHNLFLASCHP